MGSRYILDINSNDELHSVIKKCNSNFKAVVGQLELQTKNDKRTRDQDKQDTESAIEDAVDDAIEEWNQELGDAVDDLVEAIGLVDNKFDNYTKTDDLAAVALSGDYDDLSNAPTFAAVATSGDYNDLLNTPTASDYLTYSHDDILWKIENNTVGEVMKKTDVTGYTDLVVRCVGEDGNPCYTPLVLIPKDSYQNYTANGKTFKMEINTLDNNRLWWVVPAGTWELWMR